MNGDIKPKPTPQSEKTAPQPVVKTSPETEIISQTAPQQSEAPKQHWSRRPLIWLTAVLAIFIITGLGFLLWYNYQLTPVAPNSDEKVKVTVRSGMGLSQIAALLKEKDIIRSETAFTLYVRLKGVAGELQSGAYRLAKKDDVPALVQHLKSGKTDTFSITFLPGNTLKKNRQTLINAGYKAGDVDQALEKKYNHPVFKDKPATADLEGYIYGETYQFEADATPEQILVRTFDQLQSVIKKENLTALYKKRSLSLYEGITLASIIEREVGTHTDMAQVAQVFFLRLHKDMPLGSDVTYQYIADKTGVARDPNLDSPYNTRRFQGLPPGPISSPGEAALLAVAHPAKGDYLYFLSGDDDKTYFAHTNEEHEKNVREHCQKKCQII